MKFHSFKISITVLLGILTAQNVMASNDDWEFEVTPYFLAAGLDGKIGIRDVTADVDMSFSDIWDHLDAGFMGLASAQKGRWIFGLEAVYFKISGVGSKSVSWNLRNRSTEVNGALELTSEITIYSGTAAYRVIDESMKIDVLGALRYTRVDADLDLKINGVFTGPLATRPFSGARSAGDSESWIDAVVGVKAVYPISKNVDLVGYADIGGSDDSDTYQLIGGVNWQFKEDYSAKVGYRVLDWDYDDGSFKWDMQATGPYIGLGIKF
jgi:hypothetical protein